MPFTHINEVVRLTVDVPNLRLHRGREGVVVSVWLSPGDFNFEVQFPRANGSPAVRAILGTEQLETVNSKSPRLVME
ncbi:MAG: DUF4926 domain-containing protein [Sedimentisphaerales bacterium]|nr:DUF4926 domain-containing protein [Sedimentisphaerales bacterium]